VCCSPRTSAFRKSERFNRGSFSFVFDGRKGLEITCRSQVIPRARGAPQKTETTQDQHNTDRIQATHIPSKVRAVTEMNVWILQDAVDSLSRENNRRRRDSNPRDAFAPNGFQDRRLQPLGHSSKTATARDSEQARHRVCRGDNAVTPLTVRQQSRQVSAPAADRPALALLSRNRTPANRPSAKTPLPYGRGSVQRTTSLPYGRGSAYRSALAVAHRFVFVDSRAVAGVTLPTTRLIVKSGGGQAHQVMEEPGSAAWHGAGCSLCYVGLDGSAVNYGVTGRAI
jgi:hypothetical protein